MSESLRRRHGHRQPQPVRYRGNQLLQKHRNDQHIKAGEVRRRDKAAVRDAIGEVFDATVMAQAEAIVREYDGDKALVVEASVGAEGAIPLPTQDGGRFGEPIRIPQPVVERLGLRA